MSYEVLVTAGVSGPPGGEVPYFDTAQDLRDYDYPTEGGVAVTLGSLAVDDNGGGQWRWDSSSEIEETYNEEDQIVGPIIKPVGYTGAGRWVLQYNDEMLASQWGCSTSRNDNDKPLNAAMEFLTPRVSGSSGLEMVTALAEIKVINGESKTYPISDMVVWRDAVALKRIGLRATADMPSMLATPNFHSLGYETIPADSAQTWWPNVIDWLHCAADGYEMTLATNDTEPVKAIIGVHSDWLQWDTVTVEGCKGRDNPGTHIDAGTQVDCHLDATGVFIRYGDHFDNPGRVFFAESWTRHIKAIRCSTGIFLRHGDSEHGILTAQKCLDVGVNLRATNSWVHIHVYGGQAASQASDPSRYRGIGVLMRPGNSTGGRSITAETTDYGVVYARGTYRMQNIDHVFYNNTIADLVVDEAFLQGRFILRTGTRSSNWEHANGIQCINDGIFNNAEIHLVDYDRSMDVVLDGSKIDGVWTCAPTATDTSTTGLGPDGLSNILMSNSELDLMVRRYSNSGAIGDEFGIQTNGGANFVRLRSEGFVTNYVTLNLGDGTNAFSDTRLDIDGRIVPNFINDGGKNLYRFYRPYLKTLYDFSAINFAGGSSVLGEQPDTAGNDTLRCEMRGIRTASGNGVATTFTCSDTSWQIPEGATYEVFVTPLSEDAAALHWVECRTGPSRPLLTFLVAPPSGTDNLVWAYYLRITGYETP